MVTRRAQGSGIPPGHRGAWSPGGQAEEKDSAGAESVLGAPGLASYVASLPSRPFLPTLASIPWPRLCARDLSRVPPGWGVSESREPTHLPRLPRTKLTSLGTHPRPSPGPLRRVLRTWVCAWGNASACWRQRTPASLPARVLPETSPA